MKVLSGVALAFAIAAVPLVAQEKKPVPKGSVRVTVPGCTKGYVFTAGERTTESPGSGDIRPGMHLRMNGPKKMLSEIKAHEGDMIEITGLMKQGQYAPGGVGLGGGVRIGPGPTPNSGSVSVGSPAGQQVMIDLENWRLIPGNCVTR